MRVSVSVSKNVALEKYKTGSRHSVIALDFLKDYYQKSKSENYDCWMLFNWLSSINPLDLFLKEKL